MSRLSSRISTEPKEVGSIIVIYGPPGVSKTTMTSNAPNVLMAQIRDESIDVLKANGQIAESVPSTVVNDYNDMMQLLEDLRTEKHDFQFLVMDGITGMDEITNEHAIIEDCEGKRENFLAFGRGEKFAAMHWGPVLEAVKALKEERQMKIIMLGHKEAVSIRNPDGSDYLQFRPGMGKEKFAMTNKYVDGMFLLDYLVDVKDPNAPGAKFKVAGKAVGGTQRILYPVGKASFEAKNRFGLTSEIPLGRSASESWDLFVSALRGE